MKEIWKEIQAQIRLVIATAILAVLSAFGLSVLQWVKGLSITDKPIWPFELGLIGIGLLLGCFSGWFLFVQTRKKLKLAENSLAIPHKITDDYEHLKERGFWVHRKTGQRVCGSCLLPPNEIVSPLFAESSRNLYQNTIGGPPVFYSWKCGRKECGKTYPRPPDEI